VKQFFTKFVSNELVYRFKVNNIVDILVDLSSKNYSCLKLIKREKTKSAMAFANALSKSCYNVVYQAIKMNVGDKMYLRLHQEYIILELSNHKLSYQRVELFIVFQKIDNLAFRLQLLLVIRIHSIISIAQLKLTTSDFDSYNRFVDRDLSPIENQHIDSNVSNYKIERLLDKRVAHDKPYYLVK